MADPEQIIRILRYRGVTVRVDGDRLIATPHHLLDHELRRLIARFKPLIMDELQERESLSATVSNAMALSDADFIEWVAEIETAPPDDPDVDHDREALQQVRRLKGLNVVELRQEPTGEAGNDRWSA